MPDFSHPFSAPGNDRILTDKELARAVSGSVSAWYAAITGLSAG